MPVAAQFVEDSVDMRLRGLVGSCRRHRRP